VLIDPGIGLANLGKSLAEAEPEAFIGIPKAHAARVLFRWARRTVRIKVTVGDRALCGGVTLNQIRKRAAVEAPVKAVELGPEEMAAILFTSGSTGPSKGVVYTHEYFAAQVEHIRRLYGIQPGEIDLPTFPLFALFGPALGMTAIIPDMDPTRPAQVNPARIVEAIENFGVTNMFGSPAVIRRVGRYGEQWGVKLPSLRRVISAGAPVPAKELQRFTRLLAPGAQVFTPYGATECLPVSSIGSAEILGETRTQTDVGRGVCVGQPVPGLVVKIIRISDTPIPAWDKALELQPGEIGEIAVKGQHVTRSYFNLAEATALAKIMDGPGGGFYHRMGDLGYLDAQERIWFCGRKSHRVETSQGTFFTIPCEAIFNTHPAVFRSALVGVKRGAETEPVICVELEPGSRANLESLTAELRELAGKYPHTRSIQRFLVHPGFPVDIRHNAKIFREKLAIWASRQRL
jgi:olefin beta-lactone synthetase